MKRVRYFLLLIFFNSYSTEDELVPLQPKEYIWVLSKWEKCVVISGLMAGYLISAGAIGTSFIDTYKST